MIDIKYWMLFNLRSQINEMVADLSSFSVPFAISKSKRSKKFPISVNLIMFSIFTILPSMSDFTMR